MGDIVDIADRPASCIRCGDVLVEALARLGATRCHSCRDGGLLGELRDALPERVTRVAPRGRAARLLRHALRMLRRG